MAIQHVSFAMVSALPVYNILQAPLYSFRRFMVVSTLHQGCICIILVWLLVSLSIDFLVELRCHLIYQGRLVLQYSVRGYLDHLIVFGTVDPRNYVGYGVFISPFDSMSPYLLEISIRTSSCIVNFNLNVLHSLHRMATSAMFRSFAISQCSESYFFLPLKVFDRRSKLLCRHLPSLH